MDLFSTSLALAGAPLPKETKLDGRDLSPLLLQGKPLPEEPFFYYRGDQLAACRLGPWKLHFFTQTGYGQAEREVHDPPLLFNLNLDPGEKRNVATDHSEVIAKIKAAVESHKAGVTPGEPQLQ
jgi:arylsulfatase A-like enzyme